MVFGDVRRIVMHFDYPDYDKAMRVKRELEKEGKKVFAWTYSQIERDNTALSSDVHVLTDRHLNFFFLPKKYVLANYTGQHADMLLDLSQTQNPLMEYLTLASGCPFRVGFKADDPSIYDFVLDISHSSSDLDENAATLLFYLKSLRFQ